VSFRVLSGNGVLLGLLCRLRLLSKKRRGSWGVVFCVLVFDVVVWQG
jgi:hypothetical protein